MQVLRPAILLALVVLAPSATAAAAETAAASAVLEEETVSGAGGAQLSPQVAIDPADAARRVLVADEFTGTGNPTTHVWRRGTTAWTTVSTPLANGAASRGRGTVAWGAGNEVFLAQRGHVSSDGCDTLSGVYLSRSTNGGQTFGTGTLTMPNKPAFDPGVPQNPAFIYRNLDVARDPLSGKAVVVADALTFAQAGCVGASTGTRILIASPSLPGDSPNVTFQPTGSSPTIVALPGAPQPIALAYVNADGDIAAARCEFVGILTNCFPVGAPLPVETPQPLANGTQPIAVGPAPDLARGADGTLHLVYTVQHGTDTDVVYRYSKDNGDTWSPAVSVADPAAEQADQFLGTVAASPGAIGASSGGRVEVAFLDRRDDGVRYRPFSTSFQTWDGDSAPTRGANRPLTALAQIAPQHDGLADVGTRLGVAVTEVDATASSGPGLVFWPATTVDGAAGDLVLSRLNHGSTVPSLSFGPISTMKNVPVDVGDLLVAPDDDGDPVRVTITTAPAHGTLQGTEFVPAPGYAGPDIVSVRADDGRNVATSNRVVTVGNSTPSLPDATLVAVPQGGTVQLQLGATDADLGDALTYGLDGAVPAPLGGAVSLTPDGLLTISPPASVRSAAVIDVRVRVSDTSPAPIGVATGTATARVPVKILPLYAAVGLGVSLRRTGRAVRFDTAVTDRDQEAHERTAIYAWSFGDKTTSAEAKPVHRYPRPGRFAWKVTVTVPRSEGQSAPVTLSGVIEIPPAGATFLKMTQRLRDGGLLLGLMSRVNGTVRVTMKAGGATIKPVDVSLKAGKRRTVRVQLGALGDARTADLAVRYTAGLAGPEPTAVTRKIRLR